jgi:glycosyltransferase involved in cell wall biosynthesis
VKVAPSAQLRALVVSYAFPPVGGAGVQRVTKLVKYFGTCGVRPAVLTVANPSVPVIDASLTRDLPPDLDVTRARTLEPAYGAKQAAWAASATNGRASTRQRAMHALSSIAKQLLVPDPQVLWQPGAQRALASRLARGLDDVVLISGPPFSQFLLAPLARARGAAVVLDYRDEWSTYRSTYEMTGGRVASLVGDPLEAALLRRAHAVTTATDEFRYNLLARFSFLDPSRVHAIPNGYDPDDFPRDLPAPPRDRFVVTYAGTIFKLTSARGFIGALRRLHMRAPHLARRLDARFVGRIVDTEQGAFTGSESLGVRRLGYVPHDEVLRQLAASHLVLCLLDDVPGAERIYPAKIFELMYLGRPILTLAPAGALARLVERHALGPVLPPRDEDAIAAHLEERLRAFAEAPDKLPAPRARDVSRYDRRAQARAFADVLREATCRR